MIRVTLRRAIGAKCKGDSDGTHESEAGDTLVEVLLAVVVLGLASVALMIAFGTSISASAEHRNLSTVNTILTSASQQAISLIQQQKSVFETCYTTETATVSAYQGNAKIAMTVPAPYTSSYSAAYTEVEYWNGTSFNPVSASGPTTPCVPNAPQLITITVTENSNGSKYTNSFEVDFPLASSVANASGAATQLVWLTEPSSTSPGATALTTQPVIAVEDAAGVAVTTDLSPVTLTITTGTTGLGSLSGCSGNEVLGVVTFTGCTISADGYYVISATDGTLPAITSNLTLAGTADQLVFTTQPTAGASGSAFTQYPVVEVEDSSGTVVTTTASLTLISSGGILTGCTGLTTTTGIFNLAGCSFQGGYFFNSANGQYLPTPYTLSATVNGLIPGTSNTFHVSSFGPAAQMAFSTQPTGVASATATAAFTGQPVVTAEDSFGNVVTNFAATVTLTISSGETLSGCSQATSNGQVAFSGCAGSAYMNGVTLTAASGSLPSVTSAAFNITGVAAKLVFTKSPVAGPSGAALTSQPIITVEDSSGNVVTSATLPVSLTTSGGTLAVCSDLTPISGVITVASCTFAGTVGTSYTMTASMTGLTSATSSSFSPSSAGAATQLVYTTQPVAGYAGGPFTVNPVLKVEDSGGNVATGSTATVTLTPSGGILSGCSGLTSVAGVVNVSNCVFGGLVGTQYQMIASSPGLLQSTSSNFHPSTAGPATQLAYATAPPSIVVVGTTFPVVVNEEDQFGNIETGDSSTALSLAANNGGGGFTCSTRPLVFSNGIASYAGCRYTSGSASAFTLTASSGSLTPATVSMTVYGAPTKLVFTTAPPSSVGAGITFTVAVHEEDLYSNTETLDSTTLVNLAANNGGGGFTCVTTPTLVTNGVATYTGCSFTVPSVTAYTLTASSTGLTPTTFNTSVSAGPATKLVYTTAPPGATTAGATFSVVVKEEDQFGNIEIGDSTTTLSLAAGGGFSCVTPPTHVTNGVATFSNCSYTTASTYTLTASSTGLTSAMSNTTVSAGPATSITLTGCSSSIASGATCVATAALKDAFGNVETANNTAVSFAETAGSGSVTGLAGVTNFTNGVANVTLTGNLVGSVTIDATGDTFTSNTVTFSVTPGSASKVVFTTQPGNGISGTALATQPVVKVEDAAGNTVTSSSAPVTLTLNASSGVGTLSGCSATTISGVASFAGCDVAVTTNGTFMLTAASTGLASATSSAFTINWATQTITWTPPGSQTWGSGSVTLGASGPLGGTSASFPGTTGSSIYTSNTFNNPSSFSTSFWFNTTTSGAIAGATNKQSSVGAGNWDRQLWIDSSGHLVFGLYSPNVSGSFSEVTSPGVYDNGNWHQVVATYGAAGEDLYVDGALVASSAAGISGQNYVFYWHLGFAQTTSWPDGSVSQYFSGSLAQAALYTSQLTQSQVSALYGAATTSAESTLVLADSAVSYWPLTNAVGTTVFPDQSSGNGNTGYIEGVFPLGTATDSAGTTVTFASSTPSVCTVNGTMVTELTAGTCTITPTAPAGGNYATTTGSPSNITINP